MQKAIIEFFFNRRSIFSSEYLLILLFIAILVFNGKDKWGLSGETLALIGTIVGGWVGSKQTKKAILEGNGGTDAIVKK